MMDQILDRCEGVIGIADDIIIHGKDDAEHDRRLHKFMKVAREHGLVLNKKKCEVKRPTLSSSSAVFMTTQPPTHPPMGGGVSTNHKSSNRIESSQLGQDLLNFSDLT